MGTNAQQVDFRGLRAPWALSQQNLGLEFVADVLLLFLRPKGVIPDDAYPLNLLLVSSRESF